MADKDSLEDERIEFSEVYHSVTQGPHKPVQAVIRDQQELQKLLPDIAVPLVDFGVKQLIVVALGDKPTSGYDVRITSVMYLTDRLQGRPPLTMVNYSDTEKGGPSDRQSSPIYLVSTRRLEGEGIQSRCREMIDVRTCALNDEAQRVDHIKFKEAFMSEKKSDPGKCSDWKAWIDAMPPGRRLHVQGKCVYPMAGWTVTLEKAVPQGVNKEVLVLNRVAKPAQGQVARPETTYTPTYEQKLGPDENYDPVTIMPESVSVKVEVVH